MSPILVLQTAVISQSTMRKIYSIIQYTSDNDVAKYKHKS